MSKQIPRHQNDLEAQLQEQIGFLERSAASFDAGFIDEAKRLAVTIRVLLHDTSKSRSLLLQLGRKGIKFCDSSFQASGGKNLISYSGLAGMAVGPGVASKHVAFLDGDDPGKFRWVDFDIWWEAIIFQFRDGQLTRKQLILAVADQDGGAHVDPALDEDYARLSRYNALGRFDGEPGMLPTPIKDAELASVRQIAHEVLKTLRAGYVKKPVPPEGTGIIGGMEVFFEPTTPEAIIPLPSSVEIMADFPMESPIAKKVGRNDPCPCGSGKKFKHCCHGRT